MAEPGRDGKPRRRSRGGRGEESDGCILPVKPRTKPTANRWRRWWREGGRPEGRRAATRATVLHGCYGLYIRGLQLEATRLIAQKSAILPVSVLSRNRLHFCYIHNWLILR